VALTTAQQNAHLRQIMNRVANNIEEQDETFMALLRGCIAHVRAGGADNIEAGKLWGRLLFESVIGRSPTADDLHRLLRHHATNADDSAAGVLD
jgi:hypothetical protein